MILEAKGGEIFLYRGQSGGQCVLKYLQTVPKMPNNKKKVGQHVLADKIGVKQIFIMDIYPYHLICKSTP